MAMAVQQPLVQFYRGISVRRLGLSFWSADMMCCEKGSWRAIVGWTMDWVIPGPIGPVWRNRSDFVACRKWNDQISNGLVELI